MGMEGGSPTTIEWYLARDGHQYGPLSDAEMRKFVELGHLRDTDLVWRAGFTEWRPSTTVFAGAGQEAPGSSPAAVAEPVAEPRRRMASGRRVDAQPQARRNRESHTPAVQSQIDVSSELGVSEVTRTEQSGARRRVTAARAVSALLLLIALVAGAWLVWDNRERLGPLANVGSLVATASNNVTDASLRVSPFLVSGATGDAIEASLQRAAVWRLAKREFPEWYAAKAQQIGKVALETTDERVIARLMAESLVALRREHGVTALNAPLPALRKLANSFLDNLAELSKLGSQQCYGFISFGEGTPMVVELSRTPQHAEHLQRQMVAVFEAAIEGRRAQTAYPQVIRADYDMLSWELAKRNWTRDDLITFSDPQRLAALPPEGVCKMVQDWFSAQLDVIDSEVQARLLSHSLKPLVQG